MHENAEFEWYMRDHLFRQSNQGRLKFQKEEIGKEMSNLYLRYKNSDLEKLNKLADIVIDDLISRQVLWRGTADGSLLLTSKLCRLQCIKCYYISYLVSDESRKCLRCSSTELRNFPRASVHTEESRSR
jgi:hypothetical protein